RCGAEPVLTEDPGAIERAERLVLPGVGSFGAMMRQLADTGVVEILRERLRDERPTLGICLGMQVFFESSEESPGVRGLAVAPAASPASETRGEPRAQARGPVRPERRRSASRSSAGTPSPPTPLAASSRAGPSTSPTRTARRT